MILQQFDLTGKTAWITGGTHGLGMAMAKALGEAGATIVVNGNSSREKVDQAVRTYEEHGIKAHGFMCNPLVEMELEDWQEVIDVDLTSPFIVSQAVVKGVMARRHGKIINVCSMMSELGRQNVGAYAAAKGGLKMLSKNMATEWAKFNIQVNRIGPGYFATSQTAPLRVGGNAFNEFIISRTPAGKWGEPDELGGATVFLASRASDFVNGQILYVDGGILATIGKPYGE